MMCKIIFGLALVVAVIDVVLHIVLILVLNSIAAEKDMDAIDNIINNVEKKIERIESIRDRRRNNNTYKKKEGN